MKRILKYGPIWHDADGEVEDFPVKVDVQDGDIYVWSVVNIDKYNRRLKCRYIPTGAEFDEEHWVGTVVTPAGFVWHVIGK